MYLESDLRQQLVDRWIGDSLGNADGFQTRMNLRLGEQASRERHRPRSPSEMDRAHAKAPVRLQTDQGYQVCDRLVDFAVHDHVVELRLGGHLGPRGLQPPLALRLADSVPRPTSRRTNSCHDGGARKTNRASGQPGLDLPRSLQIDLQQRRDDPPASACMTGARGVP